jgi:hypothetical protein
MNLREITKKIVSQFKDGSLPGNYSGLHLVCLQFVAFKKIAPEQNIGFDVSAEYQTAWKLHKPG